MIHPVRQRWIINRICPTCPFASTSHDGPYLRIETIERMSHATHIYIYIYRYIIEFLASVLPHWFALLTSVLVESIVNGGDTLLLLLCDFKRSAVRFFARFALYTAKIFSCMAYIRLSLYRSLHIYISISIYIYIYINVCTFIHINRRCVGPWLVLRTHDFDRTTQKTLNQTKEHCRQEFVI